MLRIAHGQVAHEVERVIERSELQQRSVWTEGKRGSMVKTDIYGRDRYASCKVLKPLTLVDSR